MRSETLILAIIARVHATTKPTSEDSVDKLIDMLSNKLVDRLIQSPALADLDSTTLGKPAATKSLGMTQTRAAALPAVLPRPFNPSMPGCPVKVFSRDSHVAHAVVKLGSDSGGLVFVPDSITVKTGETVQFVNNAGFPHNVVFDEDKVPDGVNADDISREDYLNGPGEKYEVKFDKAGEYGFYCQPHQGAGMKGKIIVQ